MKTRLLSTCVIVGIAGNAYATEGQPTAESAVALIREWRALEMACRGSNDPAACDKRNSVAQELGQMGWCFKGYSYDHPWTRC
jgi:hypothetical protein